MLRLMKDDDGGPHGGEGDVQLAPLRGGLQLRAEILPVGLGGIPQEGEQVVVEPLRPGAVDHCV